MGICGGTGIALPDGPCPGLFRKRRALVAFDSCNVGSDASRFLPDPEEPLLVLFRLFIDGVGEGFSGDGILGEKVWR